MRIIAGTARGALLKAPKGLETRPTADRVKESLFSVLASRGAISGARVLDAFSGSGALALEALSRGAKTAVAIERNRLAAALIKENAARVHLSERITVIAADMRQALPRFAAGQFDLIFLDPPYKKGLAAAALEIIAAQGLDASGAVIAAEIATDEELPLPAGFAIVRELGYGATTKILLVERI